MVAGSKINTGLSVPFICTNTNPLGNIWKKDPLYDCCKIIKYLEINKKYSRSILRKILNATEGCKGIFKQMERPNF